MKTITCNIYMGLILLISLLSAKSMTAQNNLTTDSVVMLPGYANEVYYSMTNGTVKVGPRNTWDIAFRTSKKSSSILINEGAGVILKSYPLADTSAWATVDTAGYSEWAPMYNDPNDWENGAFSRRAGEFPDYGWGKYNILTHDIVGDSIYIITLRDTTFRKLWLVRKKSLEDIYIFRYANLDGSDPHEISLDLNAFITQDFYGFSLETNTGVAFEPAKTDWDILFTRYMSVQNDGTPYPVTGVLNNNGVISNKFHPVSLTYGEWWVAPWDSTRSPIGWDWKNFDMNNFVWTVTDSLVYFVKPVVGNVYKLIFTRFDGSSTGIIGFEKGKAQGLGVDNQIITTNSGVRVYPNPARDRITIMLTDNSTGSNVITLNDLTGKTITKRILPEGMTSLTLDLPDLTNGVYCVTVTGSMGTSYTKVIVNK